MDLKKQSRKKPVSAGGIIFNEKNEFAIVVSKTGFWSFPKGHIEKNESFLEAAKREIHEETGISELEFVKDLGNLNRIQVRPTRIRLFLFKSSKKILCPTIDKDVQDAFWVNKEEILGKLHPDDKLFFEEILKELKL